MNDQEKRDWIEIGKIIRAYNRNNSGPYIKNLRAFKYQYFKDFLKIKDSEEVELDLNPETIEYLYQLSDEKDITIDELIMEIIKKHLDEIEKEEISYRLLNDKEILEKGDEIYCLSCNQWHDIMSSIRGATKGDKTKLPVRRKIE